MSDYAIWIGLMVGVPIALKLLSVLAGGHWIGALRRMIADNAILTTLLVFFLGVALGYGVVGDGQLPDMPNDGWEGIGDLRRWVYDTECIIELYGCQARGHALFGGSMKWVS